MILTPAEFVVLGLVIERPRHGYDLDQTIAERGIRAWTNVAFSSIYYVLGKLEARQFVESDHGVRSTSRRVYSATETGRSAAAEATAEVLEGAAPSFSSFVIGLSNVDLIDSTQFQLLIRARAAVLSEQVELIEATRDAQGELPRAALLVFSYTLSAVVAERDWITALCTSTINNPGGTSP